MDFVGNNSVHDRRSHRTAWTSTEEASLLEGVSKYGLGKWKFILGEFEFHSTRSSVDLKDKFRNLKRQEEQQPHAYFKILEASRNQAGAALYRYSYAPSVWQCARSEGLRWRQILEEFKERLRSMHQIVSEEINALPEQASLEEASQVTNESIEISEEANNEKNEDESEEETIEKNSENKEESQEEANLQPQLPTASSEEKFFEVDAVEMPVVLLPPRKQPAAAAEQPKNEKERKKNQLKNRFKKIKY